MNDQAVISETEFVDKRGHKGPERRCLASGQTRHKADMIRFVLDPEGQVTPDIAEKLPGRGVWVSADKDSLNMAISKNAFARGFKSGVKAPSDLTEQTADLLRRRLLGLITMAGKAGQIYMGFDQVKSAAQSEYLPWRIEASDGSENGRGKIRVLTKAVSRELEKPITRVIGCFDSAALGKTVGRDHMTHAALKTGPLSKAVNQAAHRLSGFIPLIPQDWPDYAHEMGQKSSVKSGIRS